MKRLTGSYASYAGTYFFYFFGMAVFSSSMLSVYLRDIGKTPEEISFIVSAASLFSLGFVPFSSYLFDRVKNTKLLFGGFFILSGVFGFSFVISREIWLLFFLNGIITAFINSIDPVFQKIAGSSKYRYGSIRIWGTLGYATATQAGTLVIALGQSQLIFILLPAAAIISSFFYLYTEPLYFPPESSVEAPQEEVKENRRIFMKNPYFLLYLLLSTVFYSMSGANMTYTPLLLQDLGISTDQVGTVLSLATLVELPVLLLSNKFMDRLNGKTLLCAAFLMSAVQYAFYGVSRTAWVTVVTLLFLKSTTSTLYIMISLKVVRNLVSSHFTATALGIIGSANSIGLWALLNLSGKIVQRMGMQSLYLLYCVLCILGTLFALFLNIGNNAAVFSGVPPIQQEKQSL